MGKPEGTLEQRKARSARRGEQWVEVSMEELCAHLERREARRRERRERRERKGS
jgi:hypothetical protein